LTSDSLRLTRSLRAGLVSFSVFCVMESVRAEEPAASLEEVVISGHQLEQSLPQQLEQYGSRLDVISDQSIRNSAYLDASQALQSLAPGLFIQSKNGPFDYADISLLGSRTQDVLWLIDGVRINNRLYGTTPPTDTLPAGIIDHIEVLEGGQALFYGTSAIAGAINIVTHPFTDTPRANVSVGADTHWGRHLDGSFSDGFGPNKIVLYGSFDKSNGYRAFRSQDYQPSNTDRDRGYDVWTAGAKYALDVTDQLRLSASYQRTNANLDFANPYRVARDVNARREDMATFKIDYDLDEKTGFYVKSYYHRWHTLYDTYYNDLQNPGTLDIIYQGAFWGYDDYGINALGKFEIARGFEGLLGYDLQVYGGKDEVLFIEPNKEHTHAAFGQLRTTPDLLPNARLAAGFRYNAPEGGAHATIWNVSGQYDLTPDLFIEVELGTNFRLPSAEELFANDPQDERGNPALQPEHSRSINASVGGKVGAGGARFTWELIGFARHITDLIDYATFDEDTGQDVFGNIPGTVKVRGGEVVLGAEASESLSGRFSFEANRSRLDDGQQLTRVPRRLGKAELDFHPVAQPFGATLSVSYTGDVAASVGSAVVPYGRYTVVDLSGRYFFDSAHKQRVSVSIQNLFDRDYGTPGRGCLDVATDGPYDCSSRYLFVNRGLPLTAAIRYNYEF
jgi:outer membrane cobalamin receptor